MTWVKVGGAYVTVGEAFVVVGPIEYTPADVDGPYSPRRLLVEDNTWAYRVGDTGTIYVIPDRITTRVVDTVTVFAIPDRITTLRIIEETPVRTGG